MNRLTPVSATIHGEEFPFPRDMLESTIPPDPPDYDYTDAYPDTATQVRPLSWGDLKQLAPKTLGPLPHSSHQRRIG